MFQIIKANSATIASAWADKDLYLYITINLEYSLKDKIKNSDMHLDFIEIKGLKKKYKVSEKVDFKEFENKTFEFPLNPKDGYIDASFFLVSHNQCDITKIEFGEATDKSIHAKITGEIDFAGERVDKKTGIEQYPLNELEVELTYTTRPDGYYM